MITFNFLIDNNYTFLNVDNLNRVIRLYNGYNDHICSIFIESGLVMVEHGKIFNYKIELQNTINKIGAKSFFIDIL